jgi:hypothetical protein
VYYDKDKNNESLYLQTPFFKFIQPVEKINSNGKTYNEIYLFLTPQDPTTNSFIELINSIETKSGKHINSLSHKQLSISQVIKSSILDDENSNQVIKYIKVKLLDQTKIEHNKKRISITELNELINKVNLKFIFEINMLWLNSNKMGIYLKPLKIRAIDILPELEFEFRDDPNIDSPHENNQTEYDNIKSILNNQPLMSLNDSIFNNQHQNQQQQQQHQNQHQNKHQNKHQTFTESVSLGAFIPSSGSDKNNDNDNNLQKKLKDELFVMEHIKEKNNSKDSTRASKKNQQNKLQIYNLNNVESVSVSESEDDSVVSKSVDDSDTESSINLKSKCKTKSKSKSKSKTKSKSYSERSPSLEDSSSSICIEEYSRKSKKVKSPVIQVVQQVRSVVQENVQETHKKRGRPKKNQLNDLEKVSEKVITKSEKKTNKQKSIAQLKQLLSDESSKINNLNDNINGSDIESLEIDLDELDNS